MTMLRTFNQLNNIEYTIDQFTSLESTINNISLNSYIFENSAMTGISSSEINVHAILKSVSMLFGVSSSSIVSIKTIFENIELTGIANTVSKSYAIWKTESPMLSIGICLADDSYIIANVSYSTITGTFKLIEVLEGESKIKDFISGDFNMYDLIEGNKHIKNQIEGTYKLKEFFSGSFSSQESGE